MAHPDAWGKPQEWLDLEPGTILWLPSIARYGIVEDTCSPGAVRPQVLPCRSGMPASAADAGAVHWIQVWIDGGTGTGDEARVAQCAAEVDAVTEMVLNLDAGYEVKAGDNSWERNLLNGFAQRCGLTSTPDREFITARMVIPGDNQGKTRNLLHGLL